MNEKIMETGELSEETQKQLKVVAKGAGLMFFGLVFSKILTYFYRLIIARYYGPETYGIVSIGLSVIGVLVVFLMLGMDAGIVRFVPEYIAKGNQWRLRRAIITPLKITLPLSILVGILILLLSPYLAGIFAKDVTTLAKLNMIFQLFSITLPFSVFYALLLASCKGFRKMDYYVLTDNVLYSIILVVSLSFFYLLGLGLNGIVWSYVITIIASFLFLFYIFNTRVFSLFNHKHMTTVSVVGKISETKVMLNYAVPLFIGSIALIFLSSIDTIFLGIYKTASDVGIYNAVLPTAKFILIFSSGFTAVLVPIIVEYRTKNLKEETLIIYKSTTKWIFISGIPFLLILIFLSRNVLAILFGAEYLSTNAFLSLSILGIAFFIQSIATTSNLILLSTDKTKYAMMDIIFAVLVSIILNVILIPYYGILGAAIGTSISVIFAVLMDSFFSWKFTKMNPFDLKIIIKSLLAGICSLLIILSFYKYIGIISSIFTILITFFIFILIYFLLILFFRIFDKNDIFILKEIERKSGIKIRFIRKIFNRFIR